MDSDTSLSFSQELQRNVDKARLNRKERMKANNELFERNYEEARETIIKESSNIGIDWNHIKLEKLTVEQRKSLVSEINTLVNNIEASITAGPGYDTDGYPLEYIGIKIKDIK